MCTYRKRPGHWHGGNGPSVSFLGGDNPCKRAEQLDWETIKLEVII